MSPWSIAVTFLWLGLKYPPAPGNIGCRGKRLEYELAKCKLESCSATFFKTRQAREFCCTVCRETYNKQKRQEKRLNEINGGNCASE